MQNGALNNLSAVGRSLGSLWQSIVSVSLPHDKISGDIFTYIVKQSYIRLNAAGPRTELTSSGMGGAWFNEPSL